MKRSLLPLVFGSASFLMTSCTPYESASGPPPTDHQHTNLDHIGPPPDYAGYAGPRPSAGPNVSQNFYGGPRDWYNSGFTQGQQDRMAHGFDFLRVGSSAAPVTPDGRLSEDYRRHADLFDERTKAEFVHGYHDGYVGINH